MDEPSGVDISSTTLVAWIRDHPNDNMAWRDLIARYEPRIRDWGRALELQPADVDDLCNEILSRLFADGKLYLFDRTKGRFRGWLHTMVVHQVVDAGRASARRPGDFGRGGPDADEQLRDIPFVGEEDILTLIASVEEQRRRDLALQEALPWLEMKHPNYWRCLSVVLREPDRPKKELAETLELPVGTFYVSLKRGLTKIQEFVRAFEDGEGEGL
jgi:RNA polymerase sigma factor (sigma-70 family)